jgi:hypothetical protein
MIKKECKGRLYWICLAFGVGEMYDVIILEDVYFFNSWNGVHPQSLQHAL